MFTLMKTIARNAVTELEDTAAVKFALTTLGYYDDTETGLAPYADDRLFHSIRVFQKDHDLEVDGVMKPDGSTQAKINEWLKTDPKSGSAFGDFWKNFNLMKKADYKGADKYFHCKANYEATERGWDGFAAAGFLSNLREAAFIPKEFIKDGPISALVDTMEDQTANRHGRTTAMSGNYSSSVEACAIYRPKGLDEKY